MARGQRARRGGRRQSLLRWAVIGVVLVLVVRAFLEITGSDNPNANAERVVIPRGSSMRAASDSLAAHGIIASPRLFRWYASVRDLERAIKPGTYQFAPGVGYAYVLDGLVTGRGIMRTVVIPEGFDLRDITPLLAKALGVPADSVRAAVTDTTWRRKLDVPAPSLEGYLFPATYTFTDGTTAREAVDAMLKRFEQVWRPEWNARLQELAISRHDLITMASIVEKEARKAPERPLISAVYWNRVRKGMLLQADPTVQYALPQHVARVYFKDLAVESKYNTYKYPGLPPGPIASPGEASIVAALAPADVPYLFFVARPDGSHEFRTTFAEHQKAILDIKRARRDSAAPPNAAPSTRDRG